MKKILLALVVLTFSVAVSAKVTVYGTVSNLSITGVDLDMGFGGGANYFMDKGSMKFGLDANYVTYGGTGFSYSIIEIAPIVRFGEKFFGQVGIGMAFHTLTIDALPDYSATGSNLSIMAGCGFNINEMFVVDARIKLIDSEIGYGANIGFKF